MKKLDKNDLKKVSGGTAWCLASHTGEKNSYYLDREAYDTLTNKGYHVEQVWGAMAVSKHGMFMFKVTDADGHAILDGGMREILGAPIE